MTLSPSSCCYPIVVTALRAAGCVFAEDEAQLLVSAARTPGGLAAMVDRRATGLPLEHVLGWAEFCGRRIAVDAGVFVPRRRTEFLVHRAAAVSRARALVVDLCCGSGAVGAALVATMEGVRLHAADIDSAAVRCARRNLTGTTARVYQGDLFEPLPTALRGHVDLVVANAPYVPTGEIALLPAEARDHEPWVALDGGPDGLGVQRRVAAGAREWLAPGGHLLIETSTRQANSTRAMLAEAGLAASVDTSEELGATVATGSLLNIM